MEKKPKILAHLSLFFAVILWSTAFVVIRRAVQVYSPGTLALLRYLIASLFMILVYFRPGGTRSITTKQLPTLLGIGIIGIGIYNLSLNYAEITLTSATTSFIIAQVPVVTVIVASIFFKESLPSLGWIGLFICIIGLLLMTWMHLSFEHANAVIATLVAMIAGSLYYILQKPLLKKIHPFDLSACAIWGGTLMLSFYLPDLPATIGNAPIKITLSIIFIGIFPAAIAYALWSYGISYLPLTRAVSYLYLTPISTLFLAWFFLHEMPEWLELLGGFLALIGMLTVNLAKSQKQLSRENEDAELVT